MGIFGKPLRIVNGRLRNIMGYGWLRQKKPMFFLVIMGNFVIWLRKYYDIVRSITITGNYG